MGRRFAAVTSTALLPASVLCLALSSALAFGQTTVLASPQLGAPTSGWTVEPTPTPAGAIDANLGDVACSSTIACTAVGNFKDHAGVFVGLAERWNGSKWAIQATPAPTGLGGDSFLVAVACPTANDCTAVGYFVNSATAFAGYSEQWNGTSWAAKSMPSGKGGTFLSSVACSSIKACTAVGYSGAGTTLAERWNGTTWSLQSTPNPAGSTGTELFGVSCPATLACVAAGSSDTTHQATLVERWNGTSWAIQSTPNPAGAGLVGLSSVSCVTRTFCDTVGFSAANLSAAVKTLAERWNGSSWTIQATPNPSGQGSLAGVSCASATSCSAVGYDLNNTLAEQWNGAIWSAQSTPLPNGVRSGQFEGVACPVATACTAVGMYENSAGDSAALAERS